MSDDYSSLMTKSSYGAANSLFALNFSLLSSLLFCVIARAVALALGSCYELEMSRSSSLSDDATTVI